MAPSRVNTTVRRLLLHAAPLLLVYIALQQLYFAHVHDLSPWKGGGFGMFSTIDAPATRFLRVYLVTDSGDIPIRPRRGLNRLRGEARLASSAAAMPTPKRAERLADVLAAKVWTSDSLPPDGRDRPGVPPDGGPIPVNAVRVEIWRLTFDRTEKTVQPVRLVDVRSPRSGG